MKFLHTLILATLFSGNVAFAMAEDSHPRLCENIREKVSEDCSEESNTFNPSTGEMIKRTKAECRAQDLPLVISEASEALEDMGIYLVDANGDGIFCQPN